MTLGLSVGGMRHLMVDYILPNEVHLHIIPVDLIKVGLKLLAVLSAQNIDMPHLGRCWLEC